MKKIFMLDLHC